MHGTYRDRLTVLLLAIALLVSSSSYALEEYSGPNEDPQSGFVAAGNPITPGTLASFCPGVITWAALGTCMNTYRATGSFANYGWSTTISGTCQAWSAGPQTPPAARTVYGCLGDGANGAGGSQFAMATESVSCANSANRSLATIGSAQRCVSKCYSLRGTEVSAFVPIEDPAQTVTGACLFIEGTGSCELEALDTSNYTYGSQLYRGGTFVHVGQRCTEDASDPPSTGAVTNSPTGGTGGSAINEGDTATKASTMVTDINAAASGAYAKVDEAKDALATGTIPQFLPEGSGRWELSLTSFFPVSESCELTGHSLPNGAGSIPLTFSVCGWGDDVRDFLAWAFGLFTLVGIWSTLFGSNSKE